MRQQFGLKARAIGFCVVLVLGAVGIISAALIRENYADSIRRVTQHAVSHARSISHSAAQAVLLDDEEEIARILRAVASDGAIQMALVDEVKPHAHGHPSFQRSEHFVVEAEFDPAMPMSGPTARDSLRVERTASQLLVVVPIWPDVKAIDLEDIEEIDGDAVREFSEDSPVGFVCLVYGLDQVHAELANRVISSVAIAFLVSVVGIGLTILAVRKLLRPVQDLVETTSAIAEGRLGERAPEAAVGEIGLLARSFNHMAGRLQESYASIERKVEERTAELKTEIVEHKRTERELLREKRFSDHTIDSTPGIFYLFDDQGTFLRWNKNFERTSGYSAQELSGMQPLEFMAPQDRERVAKAIQEVFVSGESTVEAAFLSKDGSTSEYFFTGRRVTLDERNCLVGTGIDISSRKRVAGWIAGLNGLKEGLLRSGSLAGKMGRLTDGLVEIFDADLARIWIVKPGDSCKSGCVHAASAEGQDVCRCRDRCLHLIASSGRLTQTDGEVHRRVPLGGYRIGRIADGDEVKLVTNDVANDPRVHESKWARDLGLVSFAAYRLTSVDGEPIGVLALFSKQVISADEDSLLESVANTAGQVIQTARAEEQVVRISTAVQGASDAVGMADMAGQSIYHNKALIDLIGYTPEELNAIGGPSALYADRRTAEEVFSTIKAGGSWAGDVEFITRDGQRVPVHVRSNAIKDERGSMIGLLGIHTDITERRLAEAELRRAKETAEAANKAKGEFLANMSHEIRTPMNGIIGMTELALDTDLTAEQHEYLSAVMQCANSLLTLLNDILDFSKIEAGKLELSTVDFDLVPTVEDVTDLVRHDAAEKGLELICDIDPNVPVRLRGDPGRLRQVLVNLAGNAVKFTEHGEVVVSAKAESLEGGRVNMLFAVRDTGIGIPKNRQKEVFGSFVQADGTITRRYGGTGLGLAVSEQIVELMGGSIWMESEVGRGSVFTFRLPFEAVEAPTSDVKCNQGVFDPAEVLGTRRILIVDDNATNLRILDRMLDSWGCPAQSALDGATALDLLRAAKTNGESFDLIILDVQMPSMDGFEVERTVRGDASYGDPVVVFLSSLGAESDPESREGASRTRYLVKPIKQSTLLDTLVEVFAANGKPAARTAPAKPAPTVDRRRYRARILLVEDNPVNRKVATGILSRNDYEVTAAENGRVALELLERMAFDLVIMDVQMPEMDGLETTRRIRAGDRLRDIPIIAMTAHAMKGDRRRCLEAGMNDYLSKPIKPEDLQRLVAEWTSVRNRSGEGVVVPVRATAGPAGDESRLPLNIEKALGQLDGDRDLFNDVLTTFMDDLPRLTNDLKAAVDAADSQRLAAAAHTLKGAASCICAEPTRDLSKRLEDMGRKGELRDMNLLAGELFSHLDRLKVFAESLGDANE